MMLNFDQAKKKEDELGFDQAKKYELSFDSVLPPVKQLREQARRAKVLPNVPSIFAPEEPISAKPLPPQPFYEQTKLLRNVIKGFGKAYPYYHSLFLPGGVSKASPIFKRHQAVGKKIEEFAETASSRTMAGLQTGAFLAIPGLRWIGAYNILKNMGISLTKGEQFTLDSVLTDRSLTEFPKIKGALAKAGKSITVGTLEAFKRYHPIIFRPVGREQIESLQKKILDAPPETVARITEVGVDIGLLVGLHALSSGLDKAATIRRYNRLAKELGTKKELMSSKAREVLGVRKDATLDELKRSYLHRSTILHPDKPTGSHEAFVKMKAGYEYLVGESPEFKFWAGLPVPSGREIAEALKGLKFSSTQINQIASAMKTGAIESIPSVAVKALEEAGMLAEPIPPKLYKPTREQLGLGFTLGEIIKKEIGGIAPYTPGMPGALTEEYRTSVPLHLQRKEGPKLDDVARTLAETHPEFGIESEGDLLRALKTEKGARVKISALQAKVGKITAPLARKTLREEIRREREALLVSQRIGKRLAKPLPPSKMIPLIRRVTGQEPSELIVARETTLLKRRIQEINRGIRMGTIDTKQQIKQAQAILTETIKESGLEVRDKAKFLTTIKNVQTREQLERILPSIEERIVGLAETAQKRELIAGIKENISPAKLKKMRPEFAAKIKPISETFLAEKPMEKTLRGLRSTVEFVKTHPDNQIPHSRLDELRKLEKTPLRDLSVEQLRQTSDTIAHAIKLNELKNRLIIKGKLREFAEVKKQAIHNINLKTDKVSKSLTGLDSFQQEKEAPLWKKIFGTDSYNAELKCEILDGKDNGVIMQVLFNEFDDGVAESFKFLHNSEDFFKDKLKGINIDKWGRVFQRKPERVEKITIEISGGRKVTMTKGERISFNLHARNVNNSRHITTGGYAFEATPSKIVKLTQADLDKIADSLTPEELKVADTMHEYLNTVQKDAINEVSLDLLGHKIAVEDNYFHIRTNYLDRFRDELIKTGNYSQKTLEGMGIFKERQAATNALIIEDAFSALYKSIKLSSAYIGLAKPLRSAKMLLNDNDFQIAVRGIGRKDYINSLKSYLARLEGESIRLDNVDKLTQALINKLDISILGLNPFVMFKQPISYLAAATEMDVKYLKQGFAIRTTQKDIDEMMKWSPHLRDRFEGNVTRELGEIAAVGRPRRFFTGKEVISQKFMRGIRNFDQKAIGGIWRSTKFEIAEIRPDLEVGSDAFFEAVAERAWKVIRRTQPTFHIKDRSTIGMSRNVFIRLLTKYSSQRNKNWMMIRRAFEKYNRSAKSARDKGRLAKALAIISFISPLLLLMTDELRDILYKRKQKESLFRRTIERFLNYNFGIIYFLGWGFNSLVSKIVKGTFAGYDVNDPLTSTMDELIDSLANLIRSIEQAVSQERYKAGKKRGERKWKSSLKHFAIGAMDVSGRLMGIPVATVRKLLRAGVRIVMPERDATLPSGPRKGREGDILKF